MRSLLRNNIAVVLALAVSGALSQGEQAFAELTTPGTDMQISGTSGSAGTTGLAARIRNGLPPELYADFELFIYVNKAETGPWAQHMYVFVKPRADSHDPGLILIHDWPVSTGRERTERARDGERVSTATPAGFYELNPERFYTQYRSLQWQLDMPNAMFFDWKSNGRYTGLAIHGVTDPDSIAALGRRGSAGCIQLAADASKILFDLVRDSFEGQVPQFAYDTKTRVTSNSGQVARDENGRVVMGPGYRALVMIENLEEGTMTSGLLTVAHSG